MDTPRPLNLIAELTYRCPLRCGYCSNPLDWASVRDGLDSDAWGRVMHEAAALGAIHVGLTGGEPTLRPDLREIVAHAAAANLYPHLVTAGTLIEPAGLDPLIEAGLRSVQLSIQDSDPAASDAMAGTESFERKLAFARAVRARGLPILLNVVVHRGNVDRVDAIIGLARELDVERLELANVQYYGWALLNREALLPSRAQLERARLRVEAARAESARPEILIAIPDYHRERPKPCMGGWGQKMLLVDPSGRVLPCHAAADLPGLEFWRFGERSLAECWGEAPGMNAFRGEDWMEEPCRSCSERARDHGGCRCQAFALLGDAAATDPACGLAPDRSAILAARDAAEGDGIRPIRHRATSAS
ncbi:MAG: pyrroloquinoline quinone biosynthesis protein PqqE [Deltaproteobacteria bacterium]|nr:pyrroloquinoline quinone biosynthesis protein PqqE [Deltaproteobacteria bacterium]